MNSILLLTVINMIPFIDFLFTIPLGQFYGVNPWINLSSAILGSLFQIFVGFKLGILIRNKTSNSSFNQGVLKLLRKKFATKKQYIIDLTIKKGKFVLISIGPWIGIFIVSAVLENIYGDASWKKYIMVSSVISIAIYQANIYGIFKFLNFAMQ